MAETVVLPQQGNSVESVVLINWKVAVGDTVSAGDAVCEVETDKATMEVESTESGTVLALLADAGDEIPVKTPIVVVGEPGEDVSSFGAVSREGAPDRRTAEEPAADIANGALNRASEVASGPSAHAPPASGGPVGAASGPYPASPRARMRAEATGIAIDSLVGTGPGGRIIERDVTRAAEDHPATAAAATAAGRIHATGSGIGGRVTIADIEAASPPTPAATTPVEQAICVEEIAVTGVRRTIAERMHASLATTAQLTLHGSADARSLRRMRARFKSDGEALGLGAITINDMVMYAAARTAADFGELNAHFTGETIRRFAGVDLGYAVDTPRGLLVPTIRGAHTLSLAKLSRTAKELAQRAVDGKARPADLAPATITVTNLGAFGIERFTPVLNPPQVAILGVGSIALKTIETSDGGVEHIPHIGLSLTIDHQAVDGAPGARFLRALSRRIAQFDLLLAR
ncbi:MAG: 2-oxo acid dehydrogenase subunit E2 [Spirochaetales bacterium]|nr:2-oxo acid dehydrogenase subunit E2 [Spirochaetales bacterium]